MGSLIGSGRKRNVTFRGTENGVAMPVTTSLCNAWEWVDMHIMIRNPAGIWIKVNETGADINSEWTTPLSGPIFHAEAMARMFGTCARIMDTRDGECLHETVVMPQASCARVSKLKYSGQDADYNGEIKGYGYMALIPSWALYFKTKTSGYVLWEVVQQEIDAWKSIQDRHDLKVAIRRQLGQSTVSIIDTEPFTIEKWTLRYNDTTTDTYLRRWERLMPDGTWDMCGADINPFLDQLGHIVKTDEEWRAIGRARRLA